MIVPVKDDIKEQVNEKGEDMIQTERLILRPYRDHDQEDMIRILTNETIKENFVLPDFRTQEEVIQLFKKIQEWSYSNDHYEVGIYLEEKLIGFINDVMMDQNQIELGFVIHPDYHNHGYATEALLAVIDDLFEKGYQEVMAGAFVENKASIHVMEKCKMKRINKEEDIYCQKQWKHCVYYSICKDKK